MFRDFNFLTFLKHDQNVPDSDVTVEYLARHNWWIGTPETVTEKLQAMYPELGGFGVMAMLMLNTDYVAAPEAWRESMGLLAHEVMPKVRHLTPLPEAKSA